MHVMKGLSIRGRLLLAALLPVALVSAALLSLDLFGRMTGAELFGFAQTQRHTEAVLAYVAVAVVGILFGAWFALWLARRHENLTHGLVSARDELTQSGARADQNLRDQMARIEQATQAKSRFLAAASHDLRQPTHALGMFVERLRQLPLDAEAVQLIANVDASVQSMQDLLDALLDISRLEAQAVTAEVRPFALNELFDKLRIATGPIALQKGLRLRIRPTRVWLLSDAGQVHRILQNLLGNAMAYTPSGTVLLSCRPLRGGSMARIQVWDSGVGIAPEHHEAVFKDYFQVANPARDSSKGLGLGLHIVDLIARLLGLPVQLRSNLGCGSRFSIDVPLAPVPSQAHQPPQLVPQVQPPSLLLSGGKTALVLEDDRLSRHAVGSLLTSWGFKVRTADSLPMALQQIEDDGAPDLVVSDYRLADWVNGIDAVQQLRAAANRPIPACLMSGSSTPALVQAARDVGLTLLQKPVRPAKLRSLLRRLLIAPGQLQDEVVDEVEDGPAV
jgi:hypothetical protein